MLIFLLTLISVSLGCVSANAIDDTNSTMSISDNSQITVNNYEDVNTENNLNDDALSSSEDEKLCAITPVITLSDDSHKAESNSVSKGTKVTINIKASADFSYHYDTKIVEMYNGNTKIGDVSLTRYGYGYDDYCGSFDYTFSNDGTYMIKGIMPAYTGYSDSYLQATSNTITYIVGDGTSAETNTSQETNGSTPVTPSNPTALISIYDLAYPGNSTIVSSGDYVGDIAYSIVKSGGSFTDESLVVYVNDQRVGATSPNVHNRLGNLTFTEDNDWSLYVVYSATVDGKSVTATSNVLNFITRNTSGGQTNVTGGETNSTNSTGQETNTTGGETNSTNSTGQETNTTNSTNNTNTTEQTNETNNTQSETVDLELKIRDSQFPNEVEINLKDQYNALIQYYVVVPSGDLLTNEIIIFCNGEAIKTISEPVSKSYISIGTSLFLNETGDYIITAKYKYYEFLGNNLNGEIESNSVIYHVVISNETQPEATLKITVEDVTYPEKATAIVTSNIDGNYIVSVNNNNYDVVVSKGTGSVSFDVSPGKYTVNVVSKTDSSLKNTTTFTVSESPLKPIDENNGTNASGGNNGSSTDVNGTDPSGGNNGSSTDVNGTNASGGNNGSSTDVNGTDPSGGNNGSSTDVNGTDPSGGNNGSSTDVNGTDPSGGNNSTTPTIPISSSIGADDLTRGFDSPYDFKATFYDKNGNLLKNTEVLFIINGNDYYEITDEYGVAKIINQLSVGSYEVTIINPATTYSVVKNVTIVKRIAENKDITVDYSYKSAYKVCLFADNGNPVGQGESVVIKINNKKYTCITDKNGYAKLNINLIPKSYKITATYKGVTVSNKVVVKQILKSKNVKVKKSKKTKKFTATLKTSKGKAIKNKKITFKIKGKTYKAKTNKKGVATIKITQKLKVGKYKVTIKYLKTSIKKTLTIKK